MGYACAKVVRNVRAAVIATGNELTDPGKALMPGRIYNSNLYLICGRLSELGVQIVWTETVKDDAAALKLAIEKAQEQKADLILTIGGVSVGEKDIVEETYRMLGADILFSWSANEAGAPGDGRKLSEHSGFKFFGESIRGFCKYGIICAAVLEQLTGGSYYEPEYREGILVETFEKTSKVPRFVRARWENGIVMWEGKNASGTLSSLHGCNCLLEIPPGTGKGRKKEKKCG